MLCDCVEFDPVRAVLADRKSCTWCLHWRPSLGTQPWSGAGDIISWHGVSPALATEEAAEARRGRGGREHSWRNYGTKRLPFGSDVDVPGGSWGVGGQPSQQQRRMQPDHAHRW